MTLPQLSSRAYRSDIDGLRAVAVLAVILFHVDPKWLPGGFIGVDVFFVISGYLITGILAKELSEGRFTFRRFYERRIRRILPALWILLIVCVPVSWGLMLPHDAEQMGKSALWSTIAMANVYFWREVSTDYFSPQSAQLPFLHLWSLGVEEQFYVLWPVLLLGVWRLAKGRAKFVACLLAIAIAIGSTLLAEWLIANGQSRFAYYMLPTRAGELAVGAAVTLAQPYITGRMSTAGMKARAAFIAAALGWALLAYSLVLVSELDPFPGWRSLPPTFGAAALILSGQLEAGSSWLAPLRFGSAVWIGRSSYSAYLWHWPVLAWWRYLCGEPGTIAGIGLVVLILVVASASRRWVEDPARLSRESWPRTLSLYGLAPALLVAVLALLSARAERWGIPLYSTADRKAWAELETYTMPAHHIDWVCQQHILDPASLVDPKCEFGSGAGSAQILLLGDSYAAQFAPLFRVAAEAQGVRVRSVALGSCAPLAGSLQGVVAEWRLAVCEQGIPRILERARDFPLLVVGAAWRTYAQNDPKLWARLEQQLRDFTNQGHQVWVLPEVPNFEGYDAACPAKRVRVGGLLHCSATLVRRDVEDRTNVRLAELAQRIPGVRFLPLHETLCAEATCRITDAHGRYLYADPSHLSVYGAQFLADELRRMNRMPDLRP